jgi:hypothetical protein
MATLIDQVCGLTVGWNDKPGNRTFPDLSRKVLKIYYKGDHYGFKRIGIKTHGSNKLRVHYGKQY